MAPSSSDNAPLIVSAFVILISKPSFISSARFIVPLISLDKVSLISSALLILPSVKFDNILLMLFANFIVPDSSLDKILLILFACCIVPFSLFESVSLIVLASLIDVSKFSSRGIPIDILFPKLLSKVPPSIILFCNSSLKLSAMFILEFKLPVVSSALVTIRSNSKFLFLSPSSASYINLFKKDISLVLSIESCVNMPCLTLKSNMELVI